MIVDLMVHLNVEICVIMFTQRVKNHFVVKSRMHKVKTFASHPMAYLKKILDGFLVFCPKTSTFDYFN